MEITRGFLENVKKSKVLLLMAAPAVIYFFIFSYIPMAGIVLAFKEFTFDKGIFGSVWNGIENFRFFFVGGEAFRVTRNTLLYNMAFIVVNNSLQILTALALAEIGGKFFKRITQSVMFLPYFISWVLVGGFLYNLLNRDYGLVSNFIKSLGIPPLDIYNTPEQWPVLIVLFNAWKWVGYGTVVYLASIGGINQEMYEAAEIDGANIFQRIIHITLPSITPTIITLVLLSIGQIFRGDFNMFYQLTGNSGVLYETTDVIDTFVIRSLINASDYGMAAASGLYQSIMCFVIIMVTNYLVKKANKDYALF
jgi:putative aldouronate transport system permease protein